MKKKFASLLVTGKVALAIAAPGITSSVLAGNVIDGNKAAEIVNFSMKGKIVDGSGEPIMGSTISLIGSDLKTVSDIDGNFSIVVKKGDKLKISYLGFKDKFVTINNQNGIKVVLEDDVHNLQEVVAIGYGSTTVKSSTGSISQLKADGLDKNVSTNFSSALSGQVTGVQVIQTSGQPGTDSQIRVRGIGTLTAGSDPLIVVDGFPLTEGSTLNSINTASIESIEVLKDAASTAIYGSRGANGIIMIKTKGGASSKPNVTFSASLGMQQRSDRVKLVNAHDFAIFQKEARNTGYVNKDPNNRKETDSTEERKKNGASKRELLPDYILPYLNGEAGLTDTDWYDEIFRTGSISDYNISVNGGSDKCKYSFTGGYLKQNGILLGTDFEKYSASVNLWFKPSNNIVIGTSLFPSYSKQNLTQSSNTWGGTLVSLASISYPFFSPYNSDGTLAISKQIEANIAADGALTENPVAWAKMLDCSNTTARFFGNVFAEIDLLKGMKYKLNLGIDYESGQYRAFKPSNIGQYRSAAPSPAYANNNNSSTMNYLVENTLNYNAYLDKNLNHNVGVLLGQSYQKENYEQVAITATGFTDNSIKNIAGGSGFKVSPSEYQWTMLSYFGRVNYSMMDKYLLSASVRWDGSSRFGYNSKWGFFPAASMAWVLSNEPFVKKLKNVNYAKLRLSWGQSGNNQIPNYGALAVMKRSNYVFNNTLASGSMISTSPNPDLSWEKTDNFNVGVDLVLFNYLGVNVDYYNATTNDLLLEVPVPEQSGYKTSLQNIGKVRNTGFEVKVSTSRPLMLGNILLNSSLTLSANKDKVLALAPGQTQIISNQNITRVGHSIGELYGYEVIDIYKTQEDLDKYPHMAGTQLGDYIIKDLSGDKKITTEDRKSYGSPAPKVILGFNNTASYKNFELSLNLYSELGKKKYSGTLSSLESGEGFMMVTQDYFDKRWHPVDNPNGTMATPNMGNYSNDRKQALNSNLFIKNASYLQLRSLKLAYNLPSVLLSSLGISKAQVYVMGNNLFMITPYKGFSVDAESSSSVLQQGAEKYAYPMPRTYTFGVNVSF